MPSLNTHKNLIKGAGCSMTLTERIYYFKSLFDNLQDTNSRLEKLEYIRQMPDELKEDWEFILECLDGKHPFGYKIDIFAREYYDDTFDKNTVKELLQWLLKPAEQKDLSQSNIYYHLFCLGVYQITFVEPIVNRTLKLGIGRSLLPLSETSPMLAKKFDDVYDKIPNDAKLYITEKLDGNRCIAYHDGIEWNFVSRNGKPMYVKFDMSQFPESMIFDGEVMTRKQTELSVSRTMGTSDEQPNNSTKDFSEASGIINRHSYDKDLVYNIFDIIDTFSTYEQRRAILNELKHNIQGIDTDVRILPVIDVVKKRMLEDAAPYYLNKITSQGGEGIMFNIATAKYQHKRTVGLLKFKKMYTIDLRVVGWIGGTGKYEGMIGALQCIGEDGDKLIAVDVGTGLSDTQRWDWAVNDDKILGKIVEVGYFSLSQEKGFAGTRHYSLRFPRLIRVREDKSDTNLEV